MKNNPKEKKRIGAMFDFWIADRTLRLRNVFLIADNGEDESLLKGALSKLVNPIHLEKLKRLIRRTRLD